MTPDWGETPDGERIRIRTGEIEEHIVADVAYAIDHHLRWTDRSGVPHRSGAGDDPRRGPLLAGPGEVDGGDGHTCAM